MSGLLFNMGGISMESFMTAAERELRLLLVISAKGVDSGSN